MGQDRRDRRTRVARWLTHVRTLQAECRSLERMIAAERERVDGMRCALGSESVAGGARKGMEDAYARMEELTGRWQQKADESAALIADAMAATHCGSIPRLACWMHWAEGLVWREVASELGYSENHVMTDIADEGVNELWHYVPVEFRS